MKHLGDITKISGYTAPVVDCIIGGSPCQDLSIAGKRAGLDGERSGLYMEQIRIVKEMRLKDEHNGRTGVDIRPRYMVWENVPGAFSSNKGEDFRIVLEELAKIKDKDASIPMPDKGKWTTSGCIMGDGWSIAWRVQDAQFWGVPQRRRRIALVADFGGQSAPEILFVRKSVSGHSDESEPKRKETPSDASRGIRADDSSRHICTYNIGDRYGVPAEHEDMSPTLTARCGTGGNNVPAVVCFEPGAAKRLGGYVWEDLAPTLRTEIGDNRPSGAYSVESHPQDSRVGINEDGIVQTLSGRMGTGGGNVPMVMQCYSKQRRAQSSTDFETWKESDTANTLNAFDIGDVRTTEAVVYAVDQGGDKSSANVSDGTAPTLTCTHGGEPAVVYQKTIGALCARDYKGVGSQYVDEGKLIVESVPYTLKIRSGCEGGGKGALIQEDKSATLSTLQDQTLFQPITAVDCRNGTENGVNGALQSNSAHSLNGNNVVRCRYIVRRLTPLECERLQGYPDGWTDIGDWTDSKGKVHKSSDASRYKALGNSIALPPWKWALKRICACYERDATMASLFDGIGGFPYLWEQLNGKGTCLWASEIEEFPIAVTKARIG